MGSCRCDKTKYCTKTGKVLERGRKCTKQSASKFREFLAKDGIKDVWTQPWHCLRGMRETELLNDGQQNLRTICSMAGHTEATAKIHYVPKQVDVTALLEAAAIDDSVQKVCNESERTNTNTHEVYEADELTLTDSQFERFQDIAAEFEKDSRIHPE